MGVRDIQGTKFRTYTSNGAKAGDVIKFDLKGKPTLNANAAAPSSTTDTTTALIGGLALGPRAVYRGVVLLEYEERADSAVGNREREAYLQTPR